MDEFLTNAPENRKITNNFLNVIHICKIHKIFIVKVTKIQKILLCIPTILLYSWYNFTKNCCKNFLFVIKYGIPIQTLGKNNNS